MVTTAANSLMAQVHNKRQRMPLVLSEDLAWEWIQDGLNEVRIKEITHYQYPSAAMQAITIQKDFRVSAEPTEEFEYAELPVIQVP